MQSINKGCPHGPETRECYFEPLSSCTFADADAVDPNKPNMVQVLKSANLEYNRTVRTIYFKSLWWRNIDDIYSWTGISGGRSTHSESAMTAAAFAYYFNPKPWLRDEIHNILQKSIPADLDPDKTIGVPIRRSDKCTGHTIKGSAPGEMKCPPIRRYLDVVKKFLAFDPNIQNVIVTSEDKSASDEFIKMTQRELPDLRIIVNVGDVQQGTGTGHQLESYSQGVSNAAATTG